MAAEVIEAIGEGNSHHLLQKELRSAWDAVDFQATHRGKKIVDKEEKEKESDTLNYAVILANLFHCLSHSLQETCNSLVNNKTATELVSGQIDNQVALAQKQQFEKLPDYNGDAVGYISSAAYNATVAKNQNLALELTNIQVGLQADNMVIEKYTNLTNAASGLMQNTLEQIGGVVQMSETCVNNMRHNKK